MSDARSESADDQYIRLQLTAANICHPEKTNCAGEDAYAIRDYGDRQLFAVADGVSGSRKFGDPAEFSRSLLLYTLHNLELGMAIPTAVAAAVDHARGKGKKGSTTFLIGLLDSNPHECSRCSVKLYNLGDSIAMLFRAHNNERYKVLAQTLPQSETRGYFHTPFQFHHDCDHSRGVSDMQSYDWTLEPGDVLVAGTDGLFDFLDVEKVIASIERYRDNFENLADHLAKQARCAQRCEYHFDDISVVVAVAQSSEKGGSPGLAIDNFGSVS